jgi:dihydroorotate dehydrogenase (fumarate)
MDLTTRYMGLALRNPLVASASPLTGQLDDLRRLEEAGIGAVVLPSLFQEHVEAEMRRYETQGNAGAESFPEARTYLPEYSIAHSGPDRYLGLVRRAAEALDIPVIASLNGVTNEGWIGYARQIEQAGAHAIELNIYFLATDTAMPSAEVERRHFDILGAVKSSVSIPVSVKLTPYLSALGHTARALTDAGADALVLFNRLYQPDVDLARLCLSNNLTLSTRAEIRLPLLWVGILAGRVNASLAASSGVEGAEEIVKYLLVGADVVMTTSALLRHGAGYVAILLNDLRTWLSARDLSECGQIRGMLSHRRLSADTTFDRHRYIDILEAYTA